MFYDERIEGVKGKIAQRAILLSLVISLVLGGVHLANIIRNAPYAICFWLVSLEIALCAGALLALTIGFTLNKLHEKDERSEAAQSAFYNKAAKALIAFALGVFAFATPIVLYIGRPYNFSDGGFGNILYVLLFIVGIYVIYGFRRNDIYFNYSIMDSDRYYKGVFKNIGKLGLGALALLGISAVSFIGIVVIKSSSAARVVKILLDTLAVYIGGFIEIALLYLLYSFLERCSYNNESALSKSTVLSLCIAIFIYAAYAAGAIFAYATAITQAQAALLTSLLSTLDIYIKFALLIFLTYFGYEYQRIRKNRLLSAACITILLSETLAVFAAQIADGLLFVFIPELMSQDGYVINQILATINVSIEDTSSMANIVGFVLIIFALIKDGLLPKAHRLAILGFAALGGIELFLRTQIHVLSVNIYHFIAEIVILCYFAALVSCVAKKQRKNYSDITCRTE